MTKKAICNFLKTKTNGCTYKMYNRHIKKLPQCRYKNKDSCHLNSHGTKFPDSNK